MLQSLGSAGQIQRKYYQRRLPSDTSKDYYFIHRNTGITQPIIIEYGFLDNISDAKKLKENYAKYANAATEGILNYLGISSENNYYIVQKGDSLWSIANKYGVTVNELKTVNNLSSNLLSIGQKLIIPTPTTEESNNIYTVQSGDTLYKIANKYNTTVTELKNINNLSTNILSIGQILQVPSQKSEESTTIYTVKSGDTLYKIANQHNTTVTELMSLNNLKSNLLNIGQPLILPTINKYIVKSGDTLWSIANKNNTTVDNLKSKNNLTSNLLSIGLV